jgi:tetratricopeptide (TPR) repeat protein
MRKGIVAWWARMALAALTAFLGVAGIAVCGAQPGNVPGVCDKSIPGNCTPQPSPSGPRNTVTREEARAYSNYVSAFNRALKLLKQGVAASPAKGLSLCQSALSSIDEALQNEPGDGDAQNMRREIAACMSAASGTLAVLRGDFDQGIGYYRQAESEYPESHDFYEKSIAWAESVRQQAIANANAKAAADLAAQKKAQWDALWTQAFQLVRNLDYKGAEPIWRQIIALDPENGQAYGNLGMALFYQNRYADAEAAFRKWTELDPASSGAQFWLGCMLVELNRAADAEAAFRQAIQLNPKSSDALSMLASLLYDQLRYPEAEAALRQAIQLDPKNSKAELGLGNVLEDQNRYVEAEAAYRRALQLETNGSSGLRSSGLDGLGDALRDQGRNTEAEDAFRQSIQSDPKNLAPVVDLALLLEKQGRGAEAESVYRQAIQIQTDNWRLRMDLGDLLGDEKRYAEAEDMYHKALEISPGNQVLIGGLDMLTEKETKARQQGQASPPATPAVQGGEKPKDALNSGGGSPGGGPGNGDTGNATPSQKALDEANSARGATVHGLHGTNEDAGGGGSKIFDTPGEKIEAPPVDLRGVGKAPAVAALLAHIPQNDKVKNDSVIQTSVAWYSAQESARIETQQKIADVQKQIDNKQGDPGILKIEQTQYTNELATIQQNQKTAEDAIKKQLITLDLPWIEQPETPDSKNKEKQP